MKKILLFLSVIVVLQSTAQTGDLKLASDIWPPFTNIETKKTFATDLVSEALSRIDRPSQIHIVEFDNLINNIKSQTFDGSAALWISDERMEDLLFSEPYLYNQLILVGRKGSDVSATSFTDMENKRIGIVNNYAYGLNGQGADDVEFISGKSDQQNLGLLLSEEIDYMLVDALLIQYLLKYQVNDVSEYLEFGETPIAVKPLYFALGKHVPDAQDIMTAFNNEIEEMKSDGSYNEILELNWIKADMDGDGKMEMVLQGQNAGKEAPRNVYDVTYQYGDSTGSQQRYYVDGKIYSGWDKVPQQYKNEIIMGSQTVEGMGISLNFK